MRQCLKTKNEKLQEMATWIMDWQQKKISNDEKFTLTCQTISAIVSTLLIEDLRKEVFRVTF